MSGMAGTEYVAGGTVQGSILRSGALLAFTGTLLPKRVSKAQSKPCPVSAPASLNIHFVFKSVQPCARHKIDLPSLASTRKQTPVR